MSHFLFFARFGYSLNLNSFAKLNTQFVLFIY